VAIFSDIHGNAPALRAALADAIGRGATQLYNLGDSVGEAPFPNETIGLLIQYGVISIRGNFDRNVIAFEERIEHVRRRKHPARVAAIEFTAAEITPENRRYLAQLPPRRQVSVGVVSLLLCHGSPRRDNEAVFANTPAERLAEYASMTDAHVIAVGHTHLPFVRQAAGRLFVNPGSTGRPARDPRACYAMLHVSSDGPGHAHVRAEIIRVVYPIAEVVEAISRYGLPEELKAIFLKGQALP